MKFKGTKGKWVADLRGGCCAVYPFDKNNDTNGMNHDDDRNIFYSSKGSHYNGNNWIMDEEQQSNALLISKAPEMLAMLEDIMDAIDNGVFYKTYKIKDLIKEATEL